jgi:glycosyltransferase involved in cell wall biosynthesis
MILISIFIAVAIVYSALGIAMFRKYPKNTKLINSFSIVVCAHNEEEMIKPLLKSFESIDYPQDKYEIILVDDYSTDKTFQVISSFSLDKSNVQAIQPSQKYSDYKGKKAGLQSAVDIAKNDIILFTDADSTVPSNWISSFNSYYTSDMGMVLGYIRGINLKGILKFKRVISSGIFSSMVAINRAFSCTGGNLSVRRETINTVGGYERIKYYTSGDDKQLLNLITKTKWKIAYNGDVTLIERDRKFSKEMQKNQSKRHYGKFSMSSPFHQFFSILILLFYIFLPISLIIDYKLFMIYMFGMMVFYFSALITHREKLAFSDLYNLVLYPYYMLYYSVLGSFTGFEWKK